MCITSFNILASVVPKKMLTQTFSANMQNNLDWKMITNWKIIAISWSLNPAIQSLNLHIYATFEDCSLHNSWENFDTNLPWNDRKNTH